VKDLARCTDPKSGIEKPDVEVSQIGADFADFDATTLLISALR
jgi:hypothetical protein